MHINFDSKITGTIARRGQTHVSPRGLVPPKAAGNELHSATVISYLTSNQTVFGTILSRTNTDMPCYNGLVGEYGNCLFNLEFWLVGAQFCRRAGIRRPQHVRYSEVFSKFIYLFFGHFDPGSICFDNKNK